jgi:hypothetical protein
VVPIFWPFTVICAVQGTNVPGAGW